MSNILFGPAGTGGIGYEEGIPRAKELGLGAMEIEFTYGVRMTDSEAKKIGEIAKSNGILLSVHAPYYINLSSKEKAKIEASKKRILQSCERGHYLGAKYIVFHPGFYQGRPKEEVYETIKEAIVDLQKTIKAKGWNVELAPETTGKSAQFGDIDELLKLHKETGCHLCVDFAHLYARNNGHIDYDEVFNKLKGIKHIHSHFSGIVYSEKGERSHKLLEKSFFEPLAKALKKYKPDITIINESPDVFGDAVKMLKWFE
jgi:deoxyribonuclease-4